MGGWVDGSRISNGIGEDLKESCRSLSGGEESLKNLRECRKNPGDWPTDVVDGRVINKESQSTLENPQPMKRVVEIHLVQESEEILL